jgi:hypothetical protein
MSLMIIFIRAPRWPTPEAFVDDFDSEADANLLCSKTLRGLSALCCSNPASNV